MLNVIMIVTLVFKLNIIYSIYVLNTSHELFTSEYANILQTFY